MLLVSCMIRPIAAVALPGMGFWWFSMSPGLQLRSRYALTATVRGNRICRMTMYRCSTLRPHPNPQYHCSLPFSSVAPPFWPPSSRSSSRSSSRVLGLCWRVGDRCNISWGRERAGEDDQIPPGQRQGLLDKRLNHLWSVP